MVLAIILIVALVACVAVAIALVIKRKVIAGVLLGSISLVALILFFVYNFSFYFNKEQAKVDLSTDEVHETFSIDVKNHSITKESTSTRFVSGVSFDEIRKRVQKKYPDASIEVDEKQMNVTKDNKVVTIKQNKCKKFLWANRYDYTMQSECITVQLDNNQYVCVPFPKEYIDQEGAYETEMKVSCDLNQLKNFYKHFNNVKEQGNAFVLNQNGGVIVSVEGDRLVIK